MINGESYKIIVAEAAKNALAEAGGEYFERVFITHPLMDGDKCVGAIGFSVRENKIYVFKAKAVMCAMGGAVHVFKPRSTGEGFGRSWYPPFNCRSWYPPFNSGASAFFTIYAGAEMTCQEVRFIPVRFKDAYRRLHEAEPGRAGQMGALQQGEALSGQPPQLADDDRRDGRQEPDLHADGRCHPAHLRRGVRREGAQEEAQGARKRGLGGLPGHDDLAGHPLGGNERRAREEALRDHGL
jgi:hypothetical protein